jgi:hypothetical protein
MAMREPGETSAYGLLNCRWNSGPSGPLRRLGNASAPVEGEHELFGFLTTKANAIVAPIGNLVVTPYEARG